jgi:hypothetical protein
MAEAFNSLFKAELVPTLSHDAEWPYRIRMDFEPEQSLDDFLDFLQEVLVIRIEQEDFLNAAIALDFYQHPVMSKSGEVVEYTETADLIRLIKGFRPAKKDEVNRAGQTLCESLSNAVLQHEGKPAMGPSADSGRTGPARPPYRPLDGLADPA